jgi:hypothetical protein
MIEKAAASAANGSNRCENRQWRRIGSGSATAAARGGGEIMAAKSMAIGVPAALAAA